MNIKKIAFFIIIIISLFIINNLVHSIYTLYQKKNLVLDAKIEVEKQEKENLELKNKLSQARDPEFVEQEARNKLFLAKPGDEIIVVSKDDLEASSSVKPKMPDTRPNWQKWWELFF